MSLSSFRIFSSTISSRFSFFDKYYGFSSKACVYAYQTMEQESSVDACLVGEHQQNAYQTVEPDHTMEQESSVDACLVGEDDQTMEKDSTVDACLVGEHQQNAYRTMEQDSSVQNQRSYTKKIHPVKNLLRFKCVCKILYPTPPLIITFHRSEGNFYLTAFDLRGRFVQQCTLPISSENLSIIPIPFLSKLLCFADYSEKRFFSYNPTTRCFFRMPDPPCFSSSGFKLLTSSYGYIPSKYEYMLVHMVYKKNSLEPWFCEVLTYSISGGNLVCSKWRSITVTTKLSRLNSSSGVFFGGAFYWVASDETGNICSLSLDVETEVFSTVRFPQGVTSSTFWVREDDDLYIMEDDNTIPGSLKLFALSSEENDEKSWDFRCGLTKPKYGYTFRDDAPLVFDSKIMLYRIANYSGIELVNYGKLNHEDRELEDGVNYDMRKWDVNIYTNLYTH